VFSVYENR